MLDLPSREVDNLDGAARISRKLPEFAAQRARRRARTRGGGEPQAAEPKVTMFASDGPRASARAEGKRTIGAGQV